jgi:hypothetical protein
MGVRLRIKPLDRRVLFAPGGALSPEAAAKQVADVARQLIAEAEAANAQALGRSVAYTTFVNGSQSENLESVRPGQSIRAEFDLGSDLLQWVYDQLQRTAPVKTGAFRDSIAMFADGTQVDALADAAQAREVVFTSLVPYARKIEGKSGRPPQSAQAPNGVFEVVAKVAAQRYGNQARIRFTYTSPTGGAEALESWARQHSAKREGEVMRRRQYSKDTRQPAIIILFR